MEQQDPLDPFYNIQYQSDLTDTVHFICTHTLDIVMWCLRFSGLGHYVSSVKYHKTTSKQFKAVTISQLIFRKFICYSFDNLSFFQAKRQHI